MIIERHKLAERHSEADNRDGAMQGQKKPY